MSWRIPPDVNSGGTLRNVPPLLSHRSLYAVSFDGYEKDIKKGAFWLEKAAMQDHKQAQFNLACLYLVGNNIEQDFSKGLELLKKSARQGFAPAMDLLSKLDDA